MWYYLTSVASRKKWNHQLKQRIMQYCLLFHLPWHSLKWQQTYPHKEAAVSFLKGQCHEIVQTVLPVVDQFTFCLWLIFFSNFLLENVPTFRSWSPVSWKPAIKRVKKFSLSPTVDEKPTKNIPHYPMSSNQFQNIEYALLELGRVCLKKTKKSNLAL